MPKKITVKIKSWTATSGTVVIFALMIILLGCAGNYGRLEPSREATNIFEAYRILSDHVYYYTGPQGRPDAIMAIQREYTLESSLWTEFNPSDGTLKKWVDSINFHHHTRVRRYPSGFDIFGPHGRQIGVWYSIWDWTSVHVEADGRVRIYPPAVQDPFGNGDGPRRRKLN